MSSEFADPLKEKIEKSQKMLTASHLIQHAMDLLGDASSMVSSEDCMQISEIQKTLHTIRDRNMFGSMDVTNEVWVTLYKL